MIRVRFAPTPSGHLFVSSARVALANFLHARRQGADLDVAGGADFTAFDDDVAARLCLAKQREPRAFFAV